MSQDAYALFQTIKTIKGHTMIRTSTYSTQKYALSDTYLLSPTNVACSTVGSMSAHIISETIPTTANHSVISLNGSPNIKFSFWASALVATQYVRITGWNKTRNNNYVPSILYYGTLATVGATTSSILSTAMKPVLTMVPDVAVGASATAIAVAGTTISTIPYRYIPCGTTTAASLVLNTFGFTHIVE
jgi:hypothetical protein